MHKKILMIYPEFPTTYWSYKHIMPFVGKKAVMPPLGLMTVAAMIPENYEVHLVDLNVSQLNKKDFEDVDLVFISAMIIQKKSFDMAVKMCIENNVPVVAGGPYPTSSHEKIEGVDYFILNEAEITLPDFFSDYEKGVPKKIYQSLKKPDITKTKPFRIDIVNVNDYAIMPVQFSRGCPFNCEFCDIIEMFGRVPRTKHPGQFILEMDAIYESGFKGGIFIVDDNFIGNKAKVKALLKNLIYWQEKHDFPFTFCTEASINLAQDDELLDLLVAANFDMVFTGIETPDPKTLAKCHKDQNTRVDLYDSIRKIQNKGIEVSAGFIIGFDTDPDDIFNLQIEFIQKSGIPVSMVGILTALPNTQLSRRLQKEGRMLGESNGNNTHELSMNFVPRMPMKKIFEGYKHVIKELYTPKNYFERSLVLIKNLSMTKNKSAKLYWSDIRALIISMIKQTFSSYGIYYIKYLIKTVIYNRSRFPQAVTTAIMGFHFFKITGDILSADKFINVMNEAVLSFEEKISNALENKDISLSGKLAKAIEKFLGKIKRKYRRMNRDLRNSTYEKYKMFENYCENSLISLREFL